MLLKGFPLYNKAWDRKHIVFGLLLKEGIDCGRMAILCLNSGLFSTGIVDFFSLPQKLAVVETKQNVRKGRKLFFCVSVVF